ncbi:MAG: glycosyltransferase family 4 protein [Actinobacteria bacterium]|nr:glycosyltransferase family 4 protein [Actinomycetota bacterium]
MRVAFANHSADTAGAERSLLNVLRVMAERGHEIDVWIPCSGPLVEQLEQIDGPAVRLHRRSSHRWMSRRGTGLVGLVRIAQAGVDTVGFVLDLRRVQPDILVVNTSVTPAPLAAGALLRIRTVVIVRESLQTNPTLRSLLPKSMIVAAIGRWSTQVVTISRYVSGHLQPWPPGSPEPVVRHPGVTIDPLPRVPRPEGDNTIRLLLLGSIGGDKGQLDAVHAAARAIRRGADLRLDMYGDGAPEEVAALRAAISASGEAHRLTLHNPVGDIRPLLARADALVMTSRNEGYGRVTVEALQSGVPVVGYRAGATTEILEDGGGVLVPVDVTALEGALHDLATDAGLLSGLSAEALDIGRQLREAPYDSDLADLIESVATSPQPARRSVWTTGPAPSRSSR